MLLLWCLSGYPSAGTSSSVRSPLSVSGGEGDGRVGRAPQTHRLRCPMLRQRVRLTLVRLSLPVSGGGLPGAMGTAFAVSGYPSAGTFSSVRPPLNVSGGGVDGRFGRAPQALCLRCPTMLR